MKNSTIAERDAFKAGALRLTGIALLWVALAALVYVPTAGDATRATLAAVAGFASFAAGLSMFADAMKREIVARLRQDRPG
jgi:hypothetical protein